MTNYDRICREKSEDDARKRFLSNVLEKTNPRVEQNARVRRAAVIGIGNLFLDEIENDTETRKTLLLKLIEIAEGENERDINARLTAIKFLSEGLNVSKDHRLCRIIEDELFRLSDLKRGEEREISIMAINALIENGGMTNQIKERMKEWLNYIDEHHWIHRITAYRFLAFMERPLVVAQRCIIFMNANPENGAKKIMETAELGNALNVLDKFQFGEQINKLFENIENGSLQSSSIQRLLKRTIKEAQLSPAVLNVTPATMTYDHHSSNNPGGGVEGMNFK